jgi:protein-disulfide isomerase
MKRVSFLSSLGAAVGLLVLVGFPATDARSEDRSSDKQTASSPPPDIQTVIHDYILGHPEVLIESLQSAKRKQEERQKEIAQTYIKDHKKELLDDPDSPVLGNPQGDVTIVEFFDYRCPYCRQVDPLLRKLIEDDPKVRVVQKQLPVLGPTSVLAARAALAARKQGKQPQMHDALITKKPDFDEDSILATARGLGLDTAKLKTDMASPEVDTEIVKSERLAKDLHLTGTPAFIVGSVLIPGATNLETLKSLIDDARDETN